MIRVSRGRGAAVGAPPMTQGKFQGSNLRVADKGEVFARDAVVGLCVSRSHHRCRLWVWPVIVVITGCHPAKSAMHLLTLASILPHRCRTCCRSS